ncbi:ABC transporter substrate-binding protein [bacterium]|nr:ABC transporter substrate-binding protein [bacterium]
MSSAIIVIAISAPALATAASTAQAGPINLTRALLDRAVEILRNHNLSLQAKREELKRMAAANFDFSEMSRATIDEHWSALTPEQREAFTRLFTRFIEDSYLDQIQGYAGQNINVLRQDLEGDHADVYSTITSPGEDPIDLELRFKREAGGWKIYDVAVDEVSITSNYRAQFDHVIREQGFDTLMADLRAKQRRLDASLGESSKD